MYEFKLVSSKPSIIREGHYQSKDERSKEERATTENTTRDSDLAGKEAGESSKSKKGWQKDKSTKGEERNHVHFGREPFARK